MLGDPADVDETLLNLDVAQSAVAWRGWRVRRPRSGTKEAPFVSDFVVSSNETND